MASVVTKPEQKVQEKVSRNRLPRRLWHHKQLLLNRELSWIEFNRRVLQEALEAGDSEPALDGMTVSKQLKEISSRLRPLIELQTHCLRAEILPALASRGISIKSYRELHNREKKTANQYFVEKVFPILTPQAVDPGHPFPYISSVSLNLCVMVQPEDTGDNEPSVGKSGARFSRIKLPPAGPLRRTRSQIYSAGESDCCERGRTFPGHDLE